MKVFLSFLLLIVLQTQWSSALDEPSFECGFNDNNLILNVSLRSPVNEIGPWFRWQDGKIPYYFKGNVIDGDKKVIHEVMDEVESHTCFKYIHHDTEPKEHHLEIVVEENSCINGLTLNFHANVQPKSNTKVLLRSHYQWTNSKHCNFKGGIMHEMMHALGVGHTQRRADRDKYITVNKDNIAVGGLSQYSICEECTLYGDVPYDCSSIMHYGYKTHSAGQGKPTMTAKDSTTCKLTEWGPVYAEGKLTPSDWRLLKIIAEKVCDMKPHACRMYQHCNYEGKYLEIASGESKWDLKPLGWNDKASSFSILPGCKLKFWQHKNYQGQYGWISEDMHCVERSWNDIISSAQCIC